MLLSLTILAACGLFNNATPTSSSAGPEVVTPVITAPPIPWQDFYIPGSLVEITPVTLTSVWEKTRFDSRVGGGEYWDKPGIPLKCPADFNLAISYLVDLGDCFCRNSLGEQVASPWADEPEVDEEGNRRPGNGYWIAHNVSDCVVISSHAGHWWRGVTKPSTHAVNGEDENIQELYNSPNCTSLAFDGYEE